MVFRKGAVSALILLTLGLTACGVFDDYPGLYNDQPTTEMYTVAIVNTFGPADDDVVTGFKDVLANQGYVEGENVTYVDITSPGDVLGADLIYCVTTPDCLSVQSVTRDIPTIFAVVTDPLEAGLVDNWDNPSGNFTGVATLSRDTRHDGRRLEFLTLIAPDIQRVLVAFDPGNPITMRRLGFVKEAAVVLGVELVLVEIRTPEEAATLWDRVPDDVDAFFSFPDAIVSAEIAADWVEETLARKLPYAGSSAEAGALLSFSPDLASIGEQAGRLAAQVLDGTPISELPVQAADYSLAINLVTAEAIGLDVPDVILRQAHVIIR